MSHLTLPANEPNSTSALPEEPSVLVAKKHHFLVRASHWLNVPILLGMILSGISIYWASPIYQHKPDPITGNFDVAADIGIWTCAHVPGLHQYSSPPDWVYNHISLGPGMLAVALRLHWLCAYLFMLNGLVYVFGVAAVDSEEANLAAAQHRVKQDEAVYARAERDRVRYQGLVDGGVVSRLEYD